MGILQGFPGGVDEYYQHLSRKSPSESSKKFKSLKILEGTWDSPGSFREFLKYATPVQLPGTHDRDSLGFRVFQGIPRGFREGEWTRDGWTTVTYFFRIYFSTGIIYLLRIY